MEDDIRGLARFKRENDDASAKYFRWGESAAKVFWYLIAGIVIAAIWVAHVEWNIATNHKNIDKLWTEVFKGKPMKDE